MEIGHFRGLNYGMSDDVIGTMLCFSPVLAHGLSCYPRGFLNFAQNFFRFFAFINFFYKVKNKEKPVLMGF